MNELAAGGTDSGDLAAATEAGGTGPFFRWGLNPGFPIPRRNACGSSCTSTENYGRRNEGGVLDPSSMRQMNR